MLAGPQQSLLHDIFGIFAARQEPSHETHQSGAIVGKESQQEIRAKLRHRGAPA
jgi:hypothetical protein